MPSVEENHLERARELWRQYQFYVYVGLAMILATITGFTLNHSSYNENRSMVNEQLYNLIDSADDEDAAAAREAYDILRQDSEFQEIDYLGAFVLSSLYFADGDYEQAAEVLEPALEGSADEGIRYLAALRLAEVLITDGKNDEAIDILTTHEPATGRLRIIFAERRGDAEYSRGNNEAARSAYEEALALASEGASFYESLINIKIGALISGVQEKDSAAAAAGDEDVEEDSDEDVEEDSDEEEQS